MDLDENRGGEILGAIDADPELRVKMFPPEPAAANGVDDHVELMRRLAALRR